MSNKLSDLNNHLFAQLERLGDEKLKGEDLLNEINKSKAITGVASQIIANGSLALEAKKLVDRGYDANFKASKLLE